MEQLQSFIKLLINKNGSSPIYNCTVFINDAKRNIYYNEVFGQMDNFGGELSDNCSFRIGSITKTFTATIILQLMEEGVLNLEDNYLDCIKYSSRKLFEKLILVESVNYSNSITIKNLLQHRSGIRDYYADDSRFLDYILNFPDYQWDWKTIMHKYFEYRLNERGVFQPGEDFYYSDTNYLLLAVLIEDLTNISFHENLEKRILNPLCLEDTYLEFYQEPKGTNQIVYPYYGLNYLKNINTSFDWGGGGLISSTKDLDLFIRSLLSGELFKNIETLQLMISFEDENKGVHSKKSRISYGLGLQQKQIGGLNLIGNNSAYGGMMFYDLKSRFSIILNLNQVTVPHKAELLLKKTLELVMPN